MADFPLIEALQGFIYASLTVVSLGVMGINAEGCDLANDCPDRNIVIIVFATFIFLLSVPMFAAYAFELSFLKRIEIFLVLAILLFNIVETGVMTSLRTVPPVLFVRELSWWGLLLALAAFFLALASGDRPKFEVSMKKTDAETPTQPTAPAPQPAQNVYTAPPPQPGTVNYTAPPPATQ